MIRMKHFSADLSAGLVVYLVALPLCLGIAMASGAPLLSGLIAGIVAGTVVAWISGSEVSVSGPAAGLTVIVAGGIASAGSFDVFLAAVLVAGIIQIGFGVLKTGTLAGLFPSSVITGMLAAIGVTIILKQIPHGLGRDSDYEGDLSFIQFFDSENTFTEILKSFVSMDVGVTLITLSCLAILLLWDTKFIKSVKFLSFIPGPLLAVIAGVGLNQFFNGAAPHFYIEPGSDHLVQLPIFNSASDLAAQLRLPVFSFEKLPVILSLAITLAVVGSIETLLCLEASEKIDPLKRLAQPNRELLAQGVGNIICGMIGGLPMTSVIVRTSANCYAGSRTRMSAFLHGVFLLISLVMIPHLMNLIPLASLAAILLVVGYKLANAKLFKKMYGLGIDQFLPFMITIVVVIFTDLLTGVFAGLVASMFFVLRANHHSAITLVEDQNHYLLRFKKDVSFPAKIQLKEALASLPDGSFVLIDGSSAVFIDRDIYDILEDFQEGAAQRGISMELRNMRTKGVGLFTTKKELLSGFVQKTSSGQ